MNSIPEPPVDVPKPASSLAARLFNVFADPGDVFQEVKASKPSTSNWLAPALIYSVVGIISVVIIFSQPAIVQQIQDQQAKVIEQQVESGKMTQAQADQAMAVGEKFTGPGMMKFFGGIFACAGSFIHIFWWAFVLWLMCQLVLKQKVPFLKLAEVAGLTTMILMLNSIVAVLLTVITGKLGITPSPALLITNFNLQNKVHVMLAALNVFSLWQIGVVSSGLSRLTDTPFTKALLIVVIYWLAYSFFFIAIGLGQMAL